MKFPLNVLHLPLNLPAGNFEAFAKRNINFWRLATAFNLRDTEEKV
jgi:hypothetical protein